MALLTPKPNVIALALIVTLFHVTTLDYCHAFKESKTVSVNITNKLDNAKTLKLHCKSKDNDLGVRLLGPDQTFGFRFKGHFFQRTLFFCGMSWPGSNTTVYTDVYVQTRDENRCSYCCWNIRATGPCFHECFSPLFYTCYEWNKN